ncbi:MAG TPA: hypothetical protein VF980_10880 [Thermoanaerobaculia bacterium]
MLRRIGGVLAGFVIAFVIVQVSEVGVHAMNPPSPAIDMHSMKGIKAYVAALPLSAFVLVLAGWCVATVAGTYAAARIARTRGAAYVVGAILFAAGVYNSFAIPQPAWFSTISLIIYVLGTLAGARLGSTPRPIAPSAPQQA